MIDILTIPKKIVRKLVSFLRAALPKRSEKKKWRRSYSQSGEDMIIDSLFGGKKDGFYVDIGANNPFVQSNTNFLHRNGWKGMNIDALPGSMKSFRRYRKKDINLELAISDSETELTYYMFDCTFYNTFKVEDVEGIQKVTGLLGTKKVKTRRIQDIFHEHNISEIDFLTIDTEGHDLKILKSIDYDSIRPKVILYESFEASFDGLVDDDVSRFLRTVGYGFFCKTVSNVLFIDKSYFESRSNP